MSINVKLFMSDTHACGHIRGEVIARHVNAQCRNVAMDCVTTASMSGIINANICVFQRAYAPALLVKLDQARDRGVATIYDIDDDLQNVPESFRGPHDFYAKPEVQAGMAAFLKSVDIVTVSTEPLADQIAKTTSKPIFVVPNYLDTEMWNGALVARMQRLLTSKEPTITIGWFASGSHGMDAKMIDDVMADVMQNPNVRLAVRGGVTEECLQKCVAMYPDRVALEPWSEIHSLPYDLVDVDIGIAPLIEHPFNDCKSNIKWLQYSALGIPSIVSKSLAYKDVANGENGLVAASQEDWFKMISLLVVNAQERHRLGMAACMNVKNRWDMSQNYKHWVDVFRRAVK